MRAVRSVAITGGTGFFGWHLRARIHALCPDVEVRTIGRLEYDDGDLLAAALSGVDCVVHLAGANRGPDDAVYEANVWLARRLVAGLDEAGGSPYLVYANSIHADKATPYGRSKREAAIVLKDWARRADSRVGDLWFPNLFGEGARPAYNSVVATFSADLAADRPSEVNASGRAELMHAQDASALVLEMIENQPDGAQRVTGQGMPVHEIYERLRRLRSGYRAAALPELRDRIDLRLFNVLRTAMFPLHCPIALDEHRDRRGMFVELARGSRQTQTSFGTTAPGRTRGDHFHFDKVERFVVVGGSGVVKLRRLFSDDVFAFPVSGEQPVAIDMPPLYAHSLTNTGTEDLLTVFWANDHFNPADPDTYSEQVEPMAVGASR